MKQSSKFWDRIAERYSKRPVADEQSYQKKLEVSREYLRQDMEVAEFACGTGSTAIALAPYVKHILATDISSKMIEIARGKADADKVDNITFEQAAIEDFSAPDQSLDAVLGHSILHLLENKEDVVGSVYRMLKPGGVFVSSTACIGDKMKFFKFIAPIGRFLGLIPMVKVFTSAELRDCISAAGFAIDYEWRPEKGMAVFIVARRPE